MTIDQNKIRELLTELLDLSLRDREQRLLKIKKDNPETFTELQSLLPFTEGDRDDLNVDPFIGEVVGQYTIYEQIGSGGMGRVYRARQKNPPRDVAFKILRRGLLSRSAAKRFEVECRLLGRLNHSGIAQVFEAGTHMFHGDQIPWIAMELVENSSAVTSYTQTQQLNTKNRLLLFKRVCEAVAEAHRHGVIHRDLKPANILVNEQGQPKIIDFGVAKAIDPLGLPTALRSLANDLVGTMQYMSPEQAKGKDVDITSDVYSLGVVLYELLSGEKPYNLDSSTIPTAIELISQAEPKGLRTINRSFRGDIETVVQCAMSSDPRKRYRSASEFCDDIQRIIDGEPIAARKESRLIRFLRKRRRIAVAIVIALPLLFTATATSIYFAYQAQHELDQKTKLLAFTEYALAINKEIIRINPEYWKTHYELSIERARQSSIGDPLLQADMLSLLYSGADIANSTNYAGTSLRLATAELVGMDTERGILLAIEYAAYEETLKRLGDNTLIRNQIARIEKLRLSVDNPSAYFSAKTLTAQAYLEIGLEGTELVAAGHRHSIEAEHIVRSELDSVFLLLAPIITRRAWSFIFDGNHPRAAANALELLNQSYIDSYRKEFGDYHPQTLRVMSLRALALKDCGEINAAIHELRLTAKITVEQLGTGHNVTWQILNNYAGSLVRNANTETTPEPLREQMKLQAASLWNEVIRQSLMRNMPSTTTSWYVNTFRDSLPEYAPSEERLLQWQKMVDSGPSTLSPQIDFRSAFDNPHE